MLFIFGTIFFLDRGLMSIGNLMVLAGVFNMIGFLNVLKSFMRRENCKQNLSLLIGIMLVFVGWSFLGMIAQLYGILIMLKNSFPTINQFLSYMPIIGTLLQSKVAAVGAKVQPNSQYNAQQARPAALNTGYFSRISSQPQQQQPIRQNQNIRGFF